MRYVKEKNCLEDETVAIVSCEISEKIMRSTYFVNTKSSFVSVNNNFCPHQDAVEFSDGFLEEKKKHFDSAHQKYCTRQSLLNSY